MTKYNNSIIKFLVLCLLSVGPLRAANQNTSFEKQNDPIQIESDQVIYKQDSGQIFYQGHVIVTSGPKKLLAEKVVVNRTQDQKIQSIVATGYPAKFTTPIKENDPLLYAYAETINYDPNLSILVLKGNAKLTHKQDSFEGPILKYALDEQKIEAITSNNQRPKMVIVPKRKS